MSIKVTIMATMVSLGIYAIGFPILEALLIFNAIFWSGIAVRLVIPKEEELIDDILNQLRPSSSDSAQLEFEKFMMKKYLELTSVGHQMIENEIPRSEESTIPLTEPESHIY